MINAEPPPEQPPYPHALKSELQRCYGSKTDTKTLWRAGGWMHQKRVAAAATLAQERGRPFSSTGFEVAPRVFRRVEAAPQGELADHWPEDARKGHQPSIGNAQGLAARS